MAAVGLDHRPCRRGDPTGHPPRTRDAGALRGRRRGRGLPLHQRQPGRHDGPTAAAGGAPRGVRCRYAHRPFADRARRAAPPCSGVGTAIRGGPPGRAAVDLRAGRGLELRHGYRTRVEKAASPGVHHRRDNTAPRQRLRQIEGRLRGVRRLVGGDRCRVDVQVSLAALARRWRPSGQSLVEGRVRARLAGALQHGGGGGALAEILDVRAQFSR